MTDIPESPLLDIKQAGAYVRMHPKTLGQHAVSQRCESIQHTPGGRRWFTVEMLDRFLKRQTQTFTAPAPQPIPASRRRPAATEDARWRRTA